MFADGPWSGWICDAAVLGAVGIALFDLLRNVRSEPRPTLRLLLLCVSVFAVAWVVRALAPWGPHVASGRDVVFIDAAILGGPNRAQAPLMAATYAWSSLFPDPLSALAWGQIGVGSLGCALIALLAWQLTRDQVVAWTSGLFAAGLVVLARVDASSSLLPAIRLFLLLSLTLAARYRRTGSRLDLAGVVLSGVAAGTGRLEMPLLVGLVFLWLAVDPQPTADRKETEKPKAALWPAGLLLMSGMGAVLVAHWTVLLLALAVGAWLVHRHGRALWRRDYWAAVLVAGLLLLPRTLEIIQIERDTSDRFPVALIFLFGHMNILLADPWLCSPLVLAGIILACRRVCAGLPDLRRYLVLVAWPAFAFYLLFMGDSSARLKLQGLGILLLLPMAGVGARVVLDWLAGRFGRISRPVWVSILVGLFAITSALLSWRSLTVETTLQQEYRLWRTLDQAGLPQGVRVYAPQTDSRKSLVVPPRVLQQRTGIHVIQVAPTDPPPAEDGALLYLSAGCRRYNDGYPLPGIDHSLVDVLLASKPSWWNTFWEFFWDRNEAMDRVLDRLTVEPWEECLRLQAQLLLEPVWIAEAVRSPYEGRFMQSAPYRFGFFRVRVRGQDRVPEPGREPESRESGGGSALPVRPR